jgi:hypothetical protein
MTTATGTRVSFVFELIGARRAITPNRAHSYAETVVEQLLQNPAVLGLSYLVDHEIVATGVYVDALVVIKLHSADAITQVENQLEQALIALNPRGLRLERFSVATS